MTSPPEKKQLQYTYCPDIGQIRKKGNQTMKFDQLIKHAENETRRLL